MSPALALNARGLAARAYKIECPGPFKSGRTDAFGQAVNVLRKRVGQPRVGPYACYDMCFAGGAQVSFCNLVRLFIFLPKVEPCLEGFGCVR
jgi:hypothetical protein